MSLVAAHHHYFHPLPPPGCVLTPMFQPNRTEPHPTPQFLKKFGGPDKPFPPPPHPGMKDGDKPSKPPRIPKDKKKKPLSKEQLKKMKLDGVGDPGYASATHTIHRHRWH